MEKQTKPTPPAFIDAIDAPEVFATEAAGFFVNQGNVTITFASLRVDHGNSPGLMTRRANLRVVLPAQGAQALALGLYDFLKSQGLDPSPKPPPGSTH
jgi:hypothetical protein